ncbi:hypothetical protein [Mucilaginibacter sp. UR6-11]|uniref:hypothetical protein n=1 Tax=Mucilaginibacter sp. UR6-11 TaxID=1435644 RepID=UPI001E35A013|nr:hypothetical protein [Mucilaginibacter sp. UR6-11]MCC8426845.1 hypothetical protein [Mucilaginibacter sp. UR6-11]
MIPFCYFYLVDIKRKKNAVFIAGFAIGFAAGIALHHHGLGVGFGILLGLVMREIYDR